MFIKIHSFIGFQVDLIIVSEVAHLCNETQERNKVFPLTINVLQ